MILDLDVYCPCCTHRLPMKVLRTTESYTVYKCRNYRCMTTISLDHNGNKVTPPNRKKVDEMTKLAMLEDAGLLTLREMAEKYGFSAKTCCNVINDTELCKRYHEKRKSRQGTTRQDKST